MAVLHRDYFIIAIFTFVNLFCLSSKGKAQELDKGSDFNTTVEIGFIGSESGTLPFWLNSNKWGAVDRTSSNGFIRLNPRLNFKVKGALDVEVGAELLGRASKDNALFFNEAYLQADWRSLRLVAGRQKEIMGLTDTLSTTGSMIQSGNTTPIPKIRIYTPNFVELPGLEQWISVKGYLSHGWMENGRFIDSPWLHQKYLYLKIMPPDFPMQVIAGVAQSTIWAGTHPEDGNFPDSFKEFWNVFTARQSDAPNAEGSPLGSTVGSYDIGLQYNFNGLKGMLYRQFYLETAKGAKLRYPRHGLWGISINWDKEFKLISKLSWEHLYTKSQDSRNDQSGSVFDFDNYYNNSTYLSGWTYHGSTIGNPLLFSDGVFFGVDNNLLTAHQIGFGGGSKKWKYYLKGTYSRNYGAEAICNDESCSSRVNNFTKRMDQYSFLLQTNIALKEELRVNIDLAYDNGELYTNQFGLGLSLAYKF